MFNLFTAVPFKTGDSQLFKYIFVVAVHLVEQRFGFIVQSFFDLGKVEWLFNCAKKSFVQAERVGLGVLNHLNRQRLTFQVAGIRTAQNPCGVCCYNLVYVELVVQAELLELLGIGLPCINLNLFGKRPVGMDAAT